MKTCDVCGREIDENEDISTVYHNHKKYTMCWSCSCDLDYAQFLASEQAENDFFNDNNM